MHSVKAAYAITEACDNAMNSKLKSAPQINKRINTISSTNAALAASIHPHY